MENELERYYIRLRKVVEETKTMADRDECIKILNERDAYLKSLKKEEINDSVLKKYKKKDEELFLYMKKSVEEGETFLISQNQKLKTAEKYRQF